MSNAKGRDGFGQFARERKAAWCWGAVFFVFGLLVIAGAALVLPWSESAKGIVRDFGIAWMVAGLVGVVTDFIAFGVGLIQTQQYFNEQVSRLEIAADAIRHEHATPEAIERQLTLLFYDKFKKYDAFVKSITKLLVEMAKLKASDDAAPAQMRIDEYIPVVGWIIERYAVEMTDGINRLEASIREHSQAPQPAVYQAPTRFALNREVFAAQTRTLEKGDCYYSLANVELYVDFGDDEFAKAIDDALARGITIRRIYNVCDSADQNNMEEYDRAAHIINTQIERFKTRNKKLFQYRFLTAEILKQNENNHVLKRELGAIEVASVGGLSGKFYGLFVHKNAIALVFDTNTVVRTTLQISPRTASTTDTSLNLESIGHYRLFDTLWKLCEKAQNPYRRAPQLQQDETPSPGLRAQNESAAPAPGGGAPQG
ncbi:MAG: hypothetical protein P4L81_02770 [Candidatus Pacebacteria bacterium]|nr:hypothetical protein [Candidatus Paceibacterota bacterium]